MKQYYWVVLLLFSTILFGQKELNDSWVKARVQFEDGRLEDGFIKDFMSVKEAQSFKSYTPNTGFSTHTTMQKVFDEKFKFKRSADDKSQNIQQKDIKYVEIISDHDIFHFDKLDLKSLNKKGEPQKSKITTFLLLQEEMDRVNIYVKTFQSDMKLLDSPIYFKSVMDDFAIPYFEIKMNVFTLFSADKITDEVKNSIKWVTRDCKEFQNYIDEEMGTAKKTRDLTEEEKADARKYQGKSMAESSAMTANAFKQMFEEYHNMCK